MFVQVECAVGGDDDFAGDFPGVQPAGAAGGIVSVADNDVHGFVDREAEKTRAAGGLVVVGRLQVPGAYVGGGNAGIGVAAVDVDGAACFQCVPGVGGGRRIGNDEARAATIAAGISAAATKGVSRAAVISTTPTGGEQSQYCGQGEVLLQPTEN
ncbi:MAG TPA: hypothetical protein ENI97_08325 [Gammaproteobacteria bacterium]|nr:hypothetical protein [Gammaproteobacteria bacterium]